MLLNAFKYFKWLIYSSYFRSPVSFMFDNCAASKAMASFRGIAFVNIRLSVECSS